MIDGFKHVGSWLKQIFESPAKKDLRASRKDLHNNKQEMQRSISVAMESNRKSSQALKVAQNALKTLEKHRNDRTK